MIDGPILVAMRNYGGSFVKSLAATYDVADADNKRRLRAAFPDLWAKYDAMARMDSRVRRANQEAVDRNFATKMEAKG